jgi:hypothetical protein
MNSSFRKAIAINEVGSVDTILKKFRPTVGMNEGAHESLSKTIKSISQMPVYGETDDIIIYLTDSKNVHVCEFNRSFFELYLDITVDLFQGQFPLLPTNAHPDSIVGDEETWTNWTTISALVDIAKVTYFFIGFKNSTDCIKYYRITHNGRDVGPSIAGYHGVDILLKPRSISTYLAQSILSGYKLNNAYIEYIYRFYQNEPLVIPAEQIYSDNIGTPPDNTGINATKQFKLTHVKEICVLFPRYVSDYTVQFNPCLEKLCLSMLNHDYPDKETDTTSARFLRSQLEAMGLDTILQCTKSLEQSYTSPVSYKTPTRDRSASDNTDFVFVIPVERQSANAFSSMV